jgi:hypothetical protein
VKPRFIEPVGESKLQKVMLASFVTLRTAAPDNIVSVKLFTSSNVEPAQHNQELCLQLMMWLLISPVCSKQKIERIKW